MHEDEMITMEGEAGSNPAERETYNLSLSDVVVPIYEEPEIGDKVVLVIFGEVGVKVGGDGVIIPTRALFDMGDFFEKAEVPELESDEDRS